MNLKDKIIAFDIDGTIANNTHFPSTYTIETIKKLSLEGYHIVLATGRPSMNSTKIYHLLNLDTFGIFSNGSFIYNIKTKQIIKDKPIAKNVIKQFFHNKELLEMLQEVAVFTLNNSYSLNGTIDYIETKPIDLKQILKEKVYNIEIMVKDSKNQERIKEIINRFNKNYSYYYWIFAGEIRNKKADKIEGFKTLLKYYGKTKKDLVFFGDSGIDNKSLKYAKYSIAMKNACDDVKQNAKEITKFDNDNDGAIKHLLEMINR